MLVTILMKIKSDYNFAKSYKQQKATMIFAFFPKEHRLKNKAGTAWVGAAFIFFNFRNIKRKYRNEKIPKKFCEQVVLENMARPAYTPILLRSGCWVAKS